MGDDAWQRLGQEVRAARSARWPKRADFAYTCGLGLRTIVSIEHGEPVDRRSSTYAVIEDTLGWAHGDCEKILHGGRPTPDRDLQYVTNAWPQLSGQARAIIVGFVDDALAATR